MPLVKLHPQNVKTLEAAGGRRTDYVDELQPGLALRVTAEGSRTYSVRYRWKGRHQRYTIGPITEHSVAAARERARQILRDVERGINPQAQRADERRREAHQTLSDVAEAFFEAKPRKRGGSWRPNTEALYRVAFDRHILPRFGKRDPDEIETHEARLWLEQLAKKTPTMAVRVLEAWRRCYGWAVTRRYVRTNPLAGLERPAETKKSGRTYTNAEIRAIHVLVDRSRYTPAQARETLLELRAIEKEATAEDVAKLLASWAELEHLVPWLFLTATRSEETRAARFGQVDKERALWTIPPEQTKTGDQTQQAHEVPLSKGALARWALITAGRTGSKVVQIRSGQFVFPAPTRTGHMDAPNKAVAALKRAMGLEKERGFLHHIRRTVADRMKKDLGVPPYVVEHCLGHAQPALGQIYTPSSPLPAMRVALQSWSDELERILAAPGAAAGVEDARAR